ncbi:hypothetical protein VAZ01S_055_00320 [Vibrio azureus NBRC 104587]|uniref:Uncharacterized protein n=1 Tax=Vibrio azureus NBRC 104587 TaxID=1219077 RepID=U3AAG0_9VIBR|nr:hypothetical protein VAZ01S_055_00320 [Vibrio azureus NBRC 104587]
MVSMTDKEVLRQISISDNIKAPKVGQQTWGKAGIKLMDAQVKSLESMYYIEEKCPEGIK